MQFTYPSAFIKDVQATEEAFSTQKRTSRTSKHEFSYCFLFLWILDPDSESGFRYRSTDLFESGSNPDPDLKHFVRLFSRQEVGYKVVPV